MLSEVWSAPHAPGPRRPPGHQQPLRSPCPARGAARSRRPAEPLQLGPAAGPGSQRREPPWDTTAGPPGHRTPWGPAGAPEMPRGGQCGRVLCRSCKALASPLKRNRQPRTLIPSRAPLRTGSARQDAPEGCGRPPGTRVRAGPCCSAGPGGARVPGERAPHGALRPERPRTRSAAPLLLETLPPSHPLWFGLQSNYPSEHLCNPQVTCIHPANGFGGSPLTQSPEGRKQARARAPGPLLALCRGVGVRLTRGWMEGRTDGRTEGWMDG